MNRDPIAELLQLQVALIRTLVDSASPGPELNGIDRHRLALVADLTRAKRIDKIRALLPSTFALIGRQSTKVAHEFTVGHPALDSHSVTNALQFYRFICRRLRQPPYLRDVGYCELALACACSKPSSELSSLSSPAPREVELRRARSVHLRCCKYDVCALLAGGHPQAVQHRAVFLVIARPPGSTSGRIFKVGEGLWRLLRMLRHWHRLQPGDAWLADAGGWDSLLRLCRQGILETRQASRPRAL